MTRCAIFLTSLLFLGIYLTGCNKTSHGTMDGERLVPSAVTPVTEKNKKFVAKFRARQQDLTIVLFDGSISTDMGFASKRPDSSYRPPCTTEFNIPSFIEEKLRWSGQQYRRYDALVDPAIARVSAFTETGTGVTKQFDAAWDWQTTPSQASGYNGLTRILTGSRPAVSFQLPSDARRNDFIYRTDYLSSAALQVSVDGMKSQVEVFDETDGTWKEADGFIFSAREKDELIPASFFPGQPYGATSLRKSIYQKRLKMRALEAHANLNITITSTDGGRLCYWGTSFSPSQYMTQFINSAKGGHSIEDLKSFEAWAVDYWKPDLIIYSCNTINEDADASPSNTAYSPDEFTDKFDAYIRRMLDKPYAPDVVAYILFTAKAHNLINEQDIIGRTNITGYGEATVFDFIDKLAERLKTLPIASANAFHHYWNVGRKNAKNAHTSEFIQLFGDQDGPQGKGFVGDYTHLNDRGARVGWEVLEYLFDF